MSESEPPAPPRGDPLAVLLPRATRFRRGMVWSGLIGAALLLAGVMAYGFLKSTPSLVAKSSDTQVARPQQGPDFNRFPHDYTGMGPASPSALANVQPAAQSSPPASSAPAAARAPSQPTDEDKARTATVFFAQAPGNFAVNSASGAAPAAAPAHARDQTSPYGDQPVPPEAQGGLTLQKNAFLNSGGANRDYVAKPLQTPVSPYEVKAGTIIPAALITGINSDLPGEIIAQVTENVFDTATGRYLLVPQGSRLVGKYDSLISYGQDRGLVVWTRLILPDGSSIDLEGMPGTDGTGAAGLADETDRHRWAFAGALAVSTLLSLGPSIAEALAENTSNGDTTNVFANPASTLGSSTSQIGENLLNRELNRPNTITVRAGWPLNVLINRDLVLRSYTNG